MKKSLKISITIFGIITVIAIIWIALIMQLFREGQPHLPELIYSPDKSKVIIPTVNYNKDVYDTYLLVHIEIQDTSSKEILYQVQTRASDRMRWSVTWFNENTVLLDSSDIGSYCWKEENGTWGETKCP